MGEKVKQRRLELGISQSELAERAELSRVEISNIERGATRFARWQTLRRLAVALEVSPDYFFN